MRRHDLMALYQDATPRDANRSTVALNQAFARRSTGGTAIAQAVCQSNENTVARRAK
jgi:hypothetical protein